MHNEFLGRWIYNVINLIDFYMFCRSRYRPLAVDTFNGNMLKVQHQQINPKHLKLCMAEEQKEDDSAVSPFLTSCLMKSLPQVRSASKSVRWRVLLLLLFFCQPVKYAVIETKSNFPYTKYGGQERPHKSGKCSYPYVTKSRLKHSTAEFHSILQLDIVS